jgi:tetratricopeptide (TPR) repeat protein
VELREARACRAGRPGRGHQRRAPDDVRAQVESLLGPGKGQERGILAAAVLHQLELIEPFRPYVDQAVLEAAQPRMVAESVVAGSALVVIAVLPKVTRNADGTWSILFDPAGNMKNLIDSLTAFVREWRGGAYQPVIMKTEVLEPATIWPEVQAQLGRFNEGYQRLGSGDIPGADAIFRVIWAEIRTRLDPSTISGWREPAGRQGIAGALVGLLENLGATAVAAGRYDESAEVLDVALTLLWKANDPVSKAKRSNLLGALGNTQVARSRWDLAEAAFLEALELLGSFLDRSTAIERSTYEMGLGEAFYGQ